MARRSATDRTRHEPGSAGRPTASSVASGRAARPRAERLLVSLSGASVPGHDMSCAGCRGTPRIDRPSRSAAARRAARDQGHGRGCAGDAREPAPGHDELDRLVAANVANVRGALADHPDKPKAPAYGRPASLPARTRPNRTAALASMRAPRRSANTRPGRTSSRCPSGSLTGSCSRARTRSRACQAPTASDMASGLSRGRAESGP